MEPYEVNGLIILLFLLVTVFIGCVWYGHHNSQKDLSKKKESQRYREWNVKEYNRELVRARLNYLEYHPEEIVDSTELMTIFDLTNRHDSELLVQWLLLFRFVPEEASKNTRQL